MAIYINSPEWFEGIDSTIELLSLVVAFIVCFYGYKVYKLTKNKSYAYFSLSFLLIGLSFIFKILSELAIYNQYVVQRIIGPWVISHTVVQEITWVHTYSHTVFRLLSIFAIFILLMVALKIENKQTLILLTYFMILTTVVSAYSQCIFHITVVIMLSMLTIHFYRNHLKNKKKNALFVTLAFLAILASHMIHIFMVYDPNIYVIGEGFQLIGFGTLLYAMMLVKKQ